MSVVLRLPSKPGTVSGFSAARAALRARLSQEIEERIAILDALDGDPDFEPNGDDEPSLGWLCSGGHSDRDGNCDLEQKEATL